MWVLCSFSNFIQRTQHHLLSRVTAAFLPSLYGTNSPLVHCGLCTHGSIITLIRLWQAYKKKSFEANKCLLASSGSFIQQGAVGAGRSIIYMYYLFFLHKSAVSNENCKLCRVNRLLNIKFILLYVLHCNFSSKVIKVKVV